jgi:hypothetical protein
MPSPSIESLTPLIHIGFSKALSTWLQQHLFLPEHGFTQALEPFSVQTLIVDPTPFTYDRQKTLDWAQQEFDKDPTGYPVITSESLSGHQQCAGYNARLLADRIHVTFPNGKILLVLREQKSIIRSLYGENIKWGMPHSLSRMLKPVRPKMSPQFHPDYLRYDLLIEYYQGLFGKENMLVLAYEQFLQEPEDFARKIFAHIGREDDFETCKDAIKFSSRANTSHSLTNLNIERLWTRFMVSNNFNYGGLSIETGKSWLERIDRLDKREKYLPGFLKIRSEEKARRLIKNRTKGVFNKSNRRTSQLTNLDLEALGYDS